MRSISSQTLGGFSLVVGPILAGVFFVLQPGGVLINSAEMNEAYATIYALSRYRGLASLSVIGVCLGLILSLYGQYVILDSIGRQASGGPLARLGFTFLAVGGAGWFVVQALNIGMADTNMEVAESLQSAVAVYKAETSIALVSILVVAVGFLLYSLGLLASNACNFIGAVLVAILSAIAVAGLVVGFAEPERMPAMIQVSRMCYVVWAVWTVSLGVRLLRQKS